MRRCFLHRLLALLPASFEKLRELAALTVADSPHRSTNNSTVIVSLECSSKHLRFRLRELRPLALYTSLRVLYPYLIGPQIVGAVGRDVGFQCPVVPILFATFSNITATAAKLQLSRKVS
ncbi:hypothetical protein BC834DRAFT_845419 [Gloeopeniophorella convolvens]|nr:hypothetical protein BC834DRAFT_845419 [Gloeopeniophorella convolvens]